MEIKARLEERMKKDGSGTYFCIVVPITKDYEKIIFINGLELNILKQVYGIKD